MTIYTPGGAAELGFVIPLTKIDVEKRMIYGIGAQGDIVDKSKEIMDYPTARPAFEAWSNDCFERSNGLSKGNLRVMHTKTVAGTIPEIDFDDDKQLVKLGAYIADDNEWKKCLAGCYTGFSVGGGYAKKWSDPATGHTRYTPIVREMSLVDNPCIPTARFAELVKADGLVELLPLVGVVHSFGQLWKSRPKSFARAWETRPIPLAPPMTFGERLVKAYEETRHPRETDGRFSSNTVQSAGAYGGIAAGGVAGHVLGSHYGGRAAARIGGAVREAVGREFGLRAGERAAARVIRLGAGQGAHVGAFALGAGGYVAGATLGALTDRYLRMRRAKQAGDHEQEDWIRRNVGVHPITREHVKLGGELAAGGISLATGLAAVRHFSKSADAPMTFGELCKAYDNTKHPREHDGKFAGKTVERAARFVGGAAGAIGGFALGAKYANKLGHLGEKAGRAWSQAAGSDSHFPAFLGRYAGRHAPVGGAFALGAAGTFAGAAVGALADRYMRVRRAKRAGKLEQYHRLNRKVTVRPTSLKQATRAGATAAAVAFRLKRVHDAMGKSAGGLDELGSRARRDLLAEGD